MFGEVNQMTYMKKKVVLVKKSGNVNYTYIKPHTIYTTNKEISHHNH